jgi:hypothetical protein
MTTEGHYRALRDEIVDKLAELDRHRGELSYAAMADCTVAVVARELAARDAVIEQIRALAEALKMEAQRGKSVEELGWRNPLASLRASIASDIHRLLSALPSTGETT